ncbi:F-type H+-transporting ATPase subunit a [Wenyingzhuangia heitensis]|uniref:ATP synthase subunit a n=1 Tax=Wenyingzhuangia heitensis TaxID=1487859 RepID=A0ABX0U5A9_9FLAO|nr:F0F1 ATP synthase subunit A [Wenyingzhuangia heitensis]NIJ44039.1 F-type H+-transporting ATPase subunit a [Wenyingzhuangia heitensis]
MIVKLNLKFLVVLMLTLTTFTSQANDDQHHADAHQTEAVQHENAEHVSSHNSHTSGANDGISTPEEITAYSQHHLADAHDFVFFSDEKTGHHYGFPLPVILVDNGLKIFMSSEFHHGEAVVSKGNAHYVLQHGKVYSSDAEGNLLEDEHGHHVHPLDISITKNVLSILVISILMLLLFISLANGYKKGPIPTGFARVLEPLVVFVRDEIARPNIGEKKYRKFMGFLLTVFFFIWITNLLGLTPLGINVTGNIAVTVCLALFTFFIVQFSGTKDYWKHIFWMPGVPVPMKIVLAPIEILGMFTKPFSLLIRLFANITAGHTVVMGLIALVYTGKAMLGTGGSIGVSLLLTLFINVIEILVAFLQAYIFTMLSSLFIGMAVEEHDHH